MKGVVFTKFIEMVEEQFSIDLAEAMIEDANVPSGAAYTAVGTYDHREMVSLLLSLSKLTGVPVPDLLKSYGRYLFGQFGRLYPSFLEGHTAAIPFLAGIESVIHVEVKKLYPDAELPRFEVLEQSPDFLHLVYRSDRHLGDLAEGLIEACIEHFGEADRLMLTRENLSEPGNPVCFKISRRT